MYTLSRKQENITLPVRDLRGNVKIKLKVQRPSAQLYRDSPLYRGHLAWEALDAEVQHLDTIDLFHETLKKG